MEIAIRIGQGGAGLPPVRGQGRSYRGLGDREGV